MNGQLTALLIAPNRELADQFTESLHETRAFQIVGDLKSYPTVAALEAKLRQLRPDVVLLDLVSNLQLAGEMIPVISSSQPPVQVVGLHLWSDSQAIVSSLRLGASEFLHAPFSAATQKEAVARLCRLRQPETEGASEVGKILVFSSTKPGSGASTLAAQTAFALRKRTGKRILLADFDLMGGTLAFYLKLASNYSLLDALQHAERMDPALWSELTVDSHGVDILTAPEMPYTQPVDQARLHHVLEYAKRLYDWVILDLPSIFHHISLVSLSESDSGFLVSTSELSSLHLTRKAVGLLTQLGIERERYQVIVNRSAKSDNMGLSEYGKLFGCRVPSLMPNDYFSLHRAVTLGQPLREGDLGRVIDSFAASLGGPAAADTRRAGALLQAKPVLSQS